MLVQLLEDESPLDQLVVTGVQNELLHTLVRLLGSFELLHEVFYLPKGSIETGPDDAHCVFEHLHPLLEETSFLISKFQALVKLGLSFLHEVLELLGGIVLGVEQC